MHSSVSLRTAYRRSPERPYRAWGYLPVFSWRDSYCTRLEGSHRCPCLRLATQRYGHTRRWEAVSYRTYCIDTSTCRLSRYDGWSNMRASLAWTNVSTPLWLTTSISRVPCGSIPLILSPNPRASLYHCNLNGGDTRVGYTHPTERLASPLSDTPGILYLSCIFNILTESGQ